MTDALLQVSGLEVCYGPSQVLFGVDLDVRRGQCVALLGRNGAGKSTTMKAIAGVIPARAGSVVYRGARIDGRDPYRIARAGIAWVPEDRQVFPEHSVDDNLGIAAKAGPDGGQSWDAAKVYASFPMLEPLRARMAGRLSGGEQQMLAIARALMGNPELLLLDEPSEGLAPVIVQQIARRLIELREGGTTILLAEQNMHFCLHIATDVAIIDKGRIAYRGTAAELRGNEEVKRRFLAV
ncbi:MAG TPA: ABC transporter ATP-binding protein [Quisquiliibacterium sp.]|nr:ABC transporter ATP-binding protein [Quisquiliibacterium sp.]